MKINQDLKEFFQKTNFLKNKGWGIRNKPWWIRTNWIALFCNRNEVVYFNSFGVEHVPEEIKEFVGNKNTIANIFLVQANNLVMYGYFCIGCIDFMLAGKKLSDFTNMLYPHDFEKNDSIILSYFKDEWNW